MSYPTDPSRFCSPLSLLERVVLSMLLLGLIVLLFISPLFVAVDAARDWLRRGK
jgi:hypothetical protein